MAHHNFAPAAPDEQIVYGACRPDYPSESPDSEAVDEWITHMREQDIERVCCLLSEKLEYYDGLVEMYRDVFGPENVCHAPIGDYGVVSEDTFHDIIFPFLQEASRELEKTVIHCSAGMGRTGHILALWLAHEREYGLEEAIRTVEQTGRNPLEAATLEQLKDLC